VATTAVLVEALRGEIAIMADFRVPSTVIGEPGDELLAWAVIEPAYGAVNIYDGPEALAETMRPLTRGQRALLAVHWCVAEVENGGFHQFFTNPTGVLADETAAGLLLIQASEAAQVLASARAVLVVAPPRVDPEASNFDEWEDAEAWDALQKQLEPLEERFYVLIADEIYPQAAAYVRAHPDEFVR
jgi:hypothetical protein